MKKVKADAKTRADMEDMNPAWLKEKGRYVAISSPFKTECQTSLDRNC